jgi:integrase
VASGAPGTRRGRPRSPRRWGSSDRLGAQVGRDLGRGGGEIRQPKPLELVELARVIEAASSADPRGRDPWPERDRALVAVFVGAGVRIGEAIALRVNDVEGRDRSPRLRVYGKGGRRRVIPVGPEVIEAVDAYLTSRRERLGSYRAPRRSAIHPGTLDYLVSTSGGRASLPHRDRWPTRCATPTPPSWWTTAPRCPSRSASWATAISRPPRSIWP